MVIIMLMAVLIIPGCSGGQAGADDGDFSVRMIEAYPNLSFDRPLWVGHAGDGSERMFVVEQSGFVRVFADDVAATSSVIFLDISARVRTVHNEEGLLALAFHPDFSSNATFFAYYSASEPRRGVLSRFHVSPEDSNRADPASEEVILEVAQPYGNHNGSTVLFGPDGFLYISFGDGGSAADPHGNGQNLETLLGTILRIDVDHNDSGLAYAVPDDNPFVGRPNARDEIWAYGLRNVWRMSFDRETGELWAGDVGQDRWEEIDLIEKGGNYGWNIREGAHLFRPDSSSDSLIDPVIEYDHFQGASVTGGYVYRGTELTDLIGSYIYADFVIGTIWAARMANGNLIENRILLEQPKNIASFGEGPTGELFICVFDGKIYRLVSN